MFLFSNHISSVTGLSLAYLDLRSLFHQKLQSFLSLLTTSLPCLKALDLSYNALDLYVPPTRRAGETLGRFLSSLPLLVRLDLRGNRLTGALPQLLLGPEAEAGAGPGLQVTLRQRTIRQSLYPGRNWSGTGVPMCGALPSGPG